MSNEQKFQEILDSNGQKICVIAGPGSGKTTCVLVPKARQLINDLDIDPEEVLLLTFSRLSALSLQEKVENLERKPKACTVHSFCLSFLLSENDHDIKERIESILLDFEKDVLISDLKLGLSQRQLFIVSLEFRDNLDDKQISPELCQKFESNGISISSDATVSIRKRGREWLVTDIDNQETDAGNKAKYVVRQTEDGLGVYQQKSKSDLRRTLKRFSAGWAIQPHDQVFHEIEDEWLFKAAVLDWLDEHKAAMMEEIVYSAVALARKIGDSQYINAPQYILVDEFQDLNRLEQEFVEILASDSRLLIVVGDPDQSIYSFKFAHPSGLSEFEKDHGAESHTLPFTGRCPKQVVRFANQLLQQLDPYRNRSDLLQALPESEDGEIHFVYRDFQLEEFREALQSIAKRIESGTKPSDIIVLVP